MKKEKEKEKRNRKKSVPAFTQKQKHQGVRTQLIIKKPIVGKENNSVMSKNSHKALYEQSQEWLKWAKAKYPILKKKKSKPLYNFDQK